MTPAAAPLVDRRVTEMLRDALLGMARSCRRLGNELGARRLERLAVRVDLGLEAGPFTRRDLRSVAGLAPAGSIPHQRSPCDD